MALFGRDLRDEKAMVGALVLVDGLECLRELRAFVRAVAKVKRG